MESPVSAYSHHSSHASRHTASSRSKSPLEGGQSGHASMPLMLSPRFTNDDGLSQLIANLDHEIPSIRMRALKNLYDKLDLGLIQLSSLANRVDLMHRLTCWLRSSTLTEEELYLIVKFLMQLSKNEACRKNFLSSQIDSLLAVATLVVKPETRIMISTLLHSVQSCFDIKYEGSPTYNDNTAAFTPNISSRSPASKYVLNRSPTSRSPGSRTVQLDNNNLTAEGQMEKGQGEGIPRSVAAQPREHYFSTSSPVSVITKPVGIEFGIPTLQLNATDRQVLASTTESVLSKDEDIVFLTTCFVRDVLLNDFPAEIFIQESGLSLGLLQVVEESWSNEKLNYSAFHALFKLSTLLRSRFDFLEKVDYYEQSRMSTRSSTRQQRGTSGYHSSRQSPYFSTSSDSNNDYFMSNFTQLLKSLVRGLNFKTSCTNLWILLNSFSLSYTKSYHLIGSSHTLALLSQEILLEVSQFFLKYSRFVNPPVLATVMINLLTCFQDVENIVLAKDIRHAIWNLAAKTNLKEKSPQTFALFLETARPFQSGLDDLKNAENLEAEFALNRVYDDWWRYEKPEAFKLRELTENESPNGAGDFRSVLLNCLHSIQNATQHKHVETGVELLREFAVTLLAKRKQRVEESEATAIQEIFSAENSLQWQEAFDKFLLVEPTCDEDEFLLIRVLDLLTFLITWMKNSQEIRSWLHPKTIEKGSAILRVLIQNCIHELDEGEGTTLNFVLRSVFDFYFVLFFGNGHKVISCETRWDFMQILVQTLERIASSNYNSTACLHCTLYGISKLTTEEAIIEKLSSQEQLRNSLLNRLVETIYIAQQNAGGELESYRNSTSIRYAATSILHIISSCKNQMSWKDCSIKLAGAVPLIWSSTDPFVRRVGFQICEIFTRTSTATSLLLSNLDSPTILWSVAYSHLTSPSEAPAPRQSATNVIINVLQNWEIMKTLIDANLQIPKWKILEDLGTLLQGNIYWHEKVSQNQAYEEEGSSDTGDAALKPLITPKVVTAISRLARAAASVPENNLNGQTLTNESHMRQACKLLLRIIGLHEINGNMSACWWKEACVSLLHAIRTLTSFVKSHPSLCLALLADKYSLSALIQLSSIECPSAVPENESKEIITDLECSIITLLKTLASNSGPYFEDLERLVLNYRTLIFPTLIEWLDVMGSTKLRGLSLEFFVQFFTLCCAKDEDKKERSLMRNLWQDVGSQYADALSQKLVTLLKTSTRTEERISCLTCCDITLRFLRISKLLVDKDFIGVLIKTLKSYALKYIELSHQFVKDHVAQEEIKWVLLVLSTIFEQDLESRKDALSKNIADALHTTRITSLSSIKNSTDRVLLHILLEALVNFTNEFPEGAHSLAVTTGVIGVASKKTVVPYSLLMEILSILQYELDLIDFNFYVSTIDLIMPLLNNITFSSECRSVLLKTNLLGFIRKLDMKNVKKWNFKQQHVKLAFMQFLLHLTVHPEMQTHIAKIDDAIDILIQLASTDSFPSSMMALEVLRNLCFHPNNRPRLLTDREFLPHLSHCISTSDSVPEVTCAVVALWSVVSNCERGKVAAKAVSSGLSLGQAVERLRKKRASSPQEEQDIKSLMSLLEMVAITLNTPVPLSLIHQS